MAATDRLCDQCKLSRVDDEQCPRIDVTVRVETREGAASVVLPTYKKYSVPGVGG